MNESILITIKKLLGISNDYNHFDIDIIIAINSVFNILNQLGVGPSTGFSISDDSAKWSDFIGSNQKLEMVKTYVYLKVRLLFDPPSSGTHIESINRQISELEWRLNVEVDPGEIEVNQ